MADKVLSHLAQLRKIFVGNERKFRSEFIEALIDELADSWKGLVFDPDNVNPLKHALANLDAPARLWDESDVKEVLIEALFVAIGKRIDFNIDEESRLSDLRDEIRSLDITDDSVPEPAVDPILPVDPEDDDADDNDGHSVSLPPMDDDDEDDAVIPDLPAVLYHGTPSDNEDVISVDGLVGFGRGKCVTLKPTIPDAFATGARHVGGDTSQVTIFSVDTEKLVAAGLVLTHANYGHGDVWEIDKIDPEFLEVNISGKLDD